MYQREGEAWRDMPRATRNISRWLAATRNKEIREHLLSATLMGLAAAAVTGVVVVGTTYWFFMLGGRFAPMDGTVLLALLGQSVCVVVVASVVEYVRWRRRQTRVSTPGGELSVADGRHRPSFLVPTEGQNEAAWDWVDWLCFPAAVLGLAAQHGLAAVHTIRTRPEDMAAVLAVLASQARRMSTSELDLYLPGMELSRPLKALLHMPGVLWWTRDGIQVSLSSDLRREVTVQATWN